MTFVKINGVEYPTLNKGRILMSFSPVTMMATVCSEAS